MPNESYTLNFNLEISKETVMELFQCMNGTVSEPYALEAQITSLIHELGIPAHIMGYRYLKDAISLSIHDKECINAVTKIVYPEVASKNNTTPSRVERAIRHAIEVAWSHGNPEVLEAFFGYTVNPNAGRPTNSQFIALVADHIRLKNCRKAS